MNLRRKLFWVFGGILMVFRPAAMINEERKKEGKPSALLGVDANLFNKKEFLEIQETVNSIHGLIDSERDSQQRLLDELKNLIQREKAMKEDKEKKLRELIQNINKKITFISDDSNQKEMHLKKEVSTLQQSIRMIQTNLSFGRKPKKEGEEQEGELPAPTLINKSELKAVMATMDSLQEILVEDKRRVKELEKQLDELALGKDEVSKIKEARVKEEMAKISEKISKINKQTEEKEKQLRKEIGILQQSIQIIQQRLPSMDLGSSMTAVQTEEPVEEEAGGEETEEEETNETGLGEEEEESGETPEMEINFEGQEEEEAKKKEKRKFGKGFYLFGR